MTPTTIDPAPPKNPGLDFYHLKREGTRLVQTLAGGVWTDYNEHDPGVTTLEQLCYALTELSYRAQLPIADLLTDPETGKIAADRQALFTAAAILSCNPTTEDDYRKLIVDRVAEAQNAWLSPRPWGEPGQPGGLYDLAVYAPGLDHRCGCDRIADVARRAREVYAAHRGLCEDLASVVVLRPLPVEVAAEVTIDDSRAADSLLAELYFTLGKTLAPELRRRPLRDLLARGETPDAIFNGPLLLEGFIADDELGPKAERFTARELARVLEGVSGVKAVRGCTLLSPGATDGGRLLCVAPDEIPDLRLGDPFTLRLTQNGLPVATQRQRVERDLARRQSEARRTYPLWPEYEQAFATPQGRARDLRAYESIQNQYPNVYGINALGLPNNTPPPRLAQARQLKGYLLAFEQQLADFFAQLAHAKDLFSLDPHLHRTYFFELLDDKVPDVEPLLRRRGDGSPGYAAGLAALVASQDPWAERRNRFLDVLLALYGEQLRPAQLAGGDDPIRRIAAKLALLKDLVLSTARRGAGFDVCGPLDDANSAGLQIKCRIQLGMPPFGGPALGDLLAELGCELADDPARATLGRPLGRRADAVEHGFSPIPPSEIAAPETPCPPRLTGQSLTPELICAAAQRENLALGNFAGETATALVCRAGAGTEPCGDWRLLERCENPTQGWRAACGWVETMGRLARALEQLYVVEHLLLRAAEPPDPRFDLDFTLSAVLSAAPATVNDPAWRRFAREVLRANVPAHLELRCAFLEPAQMARFELLYWEWRCALRRACDQPAGAEASRRLRDFLLAHQEPRHEP